MDQGMSSMFWTVERSTLEAPHIKVSSSVTTVEYPSIDEVDITAISSDDIWDCIILDDINGMEQAARPDEEPEVQNRDDPSEAWNQDEEPKVKRVRFATPEPSPPSEPTVSVYKYKLRACMVKLVSLLLCWSYTSEV